MLIPVELVDGQGLGANFWLDAEALLQ